MNNRLEYLMLGYPFGCGPDVEIPYQNSYDMLSIENSIIQILNHNNKNFTYKVHPDRRYETELLYKGIIKNFEYEKFEKIFQNYKNIIFSYPHTTTFFFTLNQRKNNILFFDNKDENKLDKAGYNFINSRANIINYSRIEKNKFKFDLEKINSLLNN